MEEILQIFLIFSIKDIKITTTMLVQWLNVMHSMKLRRACSNPINVQWYDGYACSLELHLLLVSFLLSAFFSSFFAFSVCWRMDVLAAVGAAILENKLESVRELSSENWILQNSGITISALDA